MVETVAAPVQSWFTKLETTRLEFRFGWVEIKTRLSFGEEQDLIAAMMHQSGNAVSGEPLQIEMDLSGHKIARMLAYLVDWSARDEFGNRMIITPTTIAALDPRIGHEIDAALDTHIDALAVDPTAPNEMSESP